MQINKTCCIIVLGAMIQGCTVIAKREARSDYEIPEVSEVLKERLKNAQTGPEAPRVLVDLAESYLEQARDLARSAIESGKPSDELQLRYLAEQAAAAYGVLVQAHPEWPLRPRALYYLGMLLRKVEDPKAADRWWAVLVEQHPDSDEAAEVQLSWSRDWAQNGESMKAIGALKGLLGRQDSLGARAHYWTAWAHRNAGREKVALRHYERAAVLLKDVGGDVHREALLDSIVLYNATNAEESGVAHYAALAANRGVYLEVLTRLEQRYVQVNAAKLGIPVLRELLRLSDDAERADSRATRLYQWHVTTKYEYLISEDVSLMVRAWSHIGFHRTPDEKLTVFYGDLVFDLCMQLDQKAEAKKSAKAYVPVAKAWQMYATEWPKHEQIKEGRLNLARAWDESGNTYEAAEAWSAIAKSPESDPSSKANKEAVARYLSAYEGKKAPANQWLALSGMMRHLNGARKELPRWQEGALLFRVARAHQRSGAYSRAYSLYETVVKDTPKSKQAMGSAQAMLAIRNEQRDPAALAATLNFIYGQPVGKDPAMRQELARLKPLVKGQLRAERVAAARRDGDAGFEKLLGQAGSSEEQADVYAAMAMSSRSSGDYETSKQNFAEMRKLDPGSDNVAILATQLASDALARGRISEMAQIYAQAIAAQPKRIREFGPALGGLLGKLGKGEQALKVWRRVVEADPQNTVAQEAVIWWTVDTMSDAAGLAVARQFVNSGGQSDRLAAVVLRARFEDARAGFKDGLRPRTAKEFSEQTSRFMAMRQIAEAYIPVAKVREGLTVLAILSQASTKMAIAARSLPAPTGLTAAQVEMFRSMLRTNAEELDKTAAIWRAQCVDAARTHHVWNRAALHCADSGESPVKFSVRFEGGRSPKPVLKELDVNPGDPELLLKLVGVYASSGRLGAAQVVVDWVVEQNPQHAEAKRLQGDVLWSRGEWGPAAKAYKSASARGSKLAVKRFRLMQRGDEKQAGK